MLSARDIEGMTICAERFDESGEWDGPSESDGILLVALFLGEPDEVLQVEEVGFIVGKDHTVVMALAEFRGDRKLGFWFVGFAQQPFKFSVVEACHRELVAEFGQQASERGVVILRQLGKSVVGDKVT